MDESAFNVFGSPEGFDCDTKCAERDIAVMVDEKIFSLSNREVERIKRSFAGRLLKTNVNLVCIKDGRVVRQTRGTSWETNNAIFYTYGLHPQKYPCFVKNFILPSREDQNRKLHKAVRNVLGMYARSETYRVIVRNGLNYKTTLGERLKIIESIDNNQNIWSPDCTD